MIGCPTTWDIGVNVLAALLGLFTMIGTVIGVLSRRQDVPPAPAQPVLRGDSS